MVCELELLYTQIHSVTPIKELTLGADMKVSHLPVEKLFVEPLFCPLSWLLFIDTIDNTYIIISRD